MSVLAEIAARYGVGVAPQARVQIIPPGVSGEHLVWDGKRLAQVDAQGQPLDPAVLRKLFNPGRPRRRPAPPCPDAQVQALRGQVADLVAQGLTDGQIADRLALPVSRVINYRVQCALPANVALCFDPALLAKVGLVKDMIARGFGSASIETKMGWRKGVLAKLLALDARPRTPKSRVAPQVRARRARALQLAALGWDVAQICAELGAPAHAITNDLRGAKIAAPRAGSNARAARRAQVAVLLAGGQTVAQIALALGVGQTAIFRDVAKLRAAPNDLPPRGGAVARAASARRTRVQQLAQAGVPAATIAADLGLTLNRVYKDLSGGARR